MNCSIIPEILSSRRIKFFDEREIQIFLCKESDSNYIYPFEVPFLIIDTFAKKTTKPSEIKTIDIEELKKLDYLITAKKTRKGWFKHQKVIYLLENRFNQLQGKRIGYCPNDHKIEKDIPNKKIRLVGQNAGPTGFGHWITIQ